MPTPEDASDSGVNFYRELEALFLKQLDEQPQLHTVRLKLLEVYYETREAKAFLEQARKLKAHLSSTEAPEWKKCISMGRMLDAGEALYRDESGTIAFVGHTPAPEAAGEKKVRRFGEDKHREKLFSGLAGRYNELQSSTAFLNELDFELVTVAGRPTPLQHARRLTSRIGGAQILLKRDDLSEQDTHLTIAVLGQGLLARRLGCKTLVTASVNGRRGVIAAQVAARLGLNAVVYMDSNDVHRQSSNVFRLWLLGADVQSVDASTFRNSDVREAALAHWARDAKDTFLVLGLDAAPHPYPMMAREFTTAIGRECRRQLLATIKRSPDLIVARGRTRADALGLFPAFIGDTRTRLVCVEPAPEKAATSRRESNPFDPSQVPLTAAEQKRAHVILEGSEYPGVTREHAWLAASTRVEYLEASREEAKSAIESLSHFEGIIPALETAHALGWACGTARRMKPDQSVVVMFAENVEKDLWDIGRLMGVPV